MKPVIPIIDMDSNRRAVSHHQPKKESTLVHAKPSKLLTAKELSKIKVVDNHSNNVRDTTRLKRIHLHTSSKNYIETIKENFIIVKIQETHFY